MSFTKPDFSQNCRDFAKSLGLEFRGRCAGRYMRTEDGYHPRQKAYKVVLADDEEIEKVALDLVEEVFQKHGSGWFMSIFDSVVGYLHDEPHTLVKRDEYGRETVTLGIYYFHEKAKQDYAPS